LFIKKIKKSCFMKFPQRIVKKIIEAFAEKGIEVCVQSFPSEKNGTPAYCTVSSDDERFMDIKFKVIEEELNLTAYEDSATSIDVVE